jgi:hypothetical protein
MRKPALIIAAFLCVTGLVQRPVQAQSVPPGSTLSRVSVCPEADDPMNIANTGLAAADQSANRHFSNGKALADVGSALRNCAKRIADTVHDSEQRYNQFFSALAVATDAYYSATREFLSAALARP